MCANYTPAPPPSIRLHFDAPEPTFGYAEVYPGGMAPLILAAGGARITVPAVFGLLPAFAKDPGFARRTYNARSETVALKPSYRHAWGRRQFGLAPVQAFHEPCYEGGKAVRWRIQRRDGASFGLACIWSLWRLDGIERHSLSLLTVNADRHPLMSRFHGPDDEKRSVVVIPPARYADWLNAPDGDTARDLLRLFDAGEFIALANPRPGRSKGSRTALR